MPRNHNAGPSTLRNRNRVTNKTRLKVIRDSIDADPIVLDDDEEKARVVSTAGVDAEDANEHHLQAVLSAAASRHQASARSTRTASEKEQPAPKAYIPTPDSTGVVDNYEELYPPNRWKDPATYVKSTDTVEEACSFALANGFIYYMDERDEEWLHKNNEEARGEGTSVQGAVSATNTRSSRTTKAKGKEPDLSSPVAISEDEFELVMAIFEKITHEKTEFLHHGLEQGAAFPPYSDYQDTFANELPPAMFALYSVPSWVPSPEIMSRFARVIYPYWRERRIERGGHRIIPPVNLDETDTKNESYICFRRREIKAVRKTRAQQTTYSDKMIRLQAELAMSIDLAKNVLQREQLKREAAVHGQAVWERRLALVDLKRKFPSLGSKEDDELFLDKERVAKKPHLEPGGRISIRNPRSHAPDLASPVTHAELQIRPKEREAQIRSQVEQEIARRKEENRSWDDLIDNPYQPPPVPYASRLFKIVASSRSALSHSSTEEEPVREVRAGRLRFGRGGRLHLDRRVLHTRAGSRRDAWFPYDSDDDSDVELMDRKQKLVERWRFDNDDVPAFAAEGPDETDRVLVDDFQSKYLVHHMTLLSDADHQSLTTDPTLHMTGSDGRPQAVVPYKLGPQPVPRRDQVAVQRPGASGLSTGANTPSIQQINGSSLVTSSPANPTPVSVSTQIKKMAAPSVPHMRISSNGGMRASGPPALPAIPPVPTPSESPQSTPPHSASLVNGFHDGTDADAKLPLQPPVNGNQRSPEQIQSEVLAAALASSPTRISKSQNQQQFPNAPNGYVPMSAYAQISNAAAYMHPQARGPGLSMQALKSAYVGLNQTSEGNNNSVPMRAPNGAYVAHVLPNNANYNMQQLAAVRHMNWTAAQRPPSANGEPNGTDGAGSPGMSPAMPGTPTRVPSANGIRNGPLSRGFAVAAVNHTLNGQGRVSPGNIARLTPHSPTPHMLSPSLAAAQASPTRQSQVPLASPSPSMQTRQVVGSSGAGY